ncbi:MAG TPA: hypothetical protein VHT71_21685, partial [Methylomirabilota bacterium]|nr:hypothetical protein [Methylomirabilota bacterium]
MHTLTQRRLSLLGFGLAGLLLLAVGWLSYVQMVRLGRARDLATHTLLVRGEIEVIQHHAPRAGGDRTQHAHAAAAHRR